MQNLGLNKRQIKAVSENIGRFLEPDDLTELHKDIEQINKLARLI